MRTHTTADAYVVAVLSTMKPTAVQVEPNQVPIASLRRRSRPRPCHETVVRRRVVDETVVTRR